MTRRRSEANRKPVDPEVVEQPEAEEQAPPEPAAEPTAATAKPERLGPVPFTQMGPPNFPPRAPEKEKPDRGPRGRHGQISAAVRCASLECKLPQIPAGYFVFSFDRPWKGEGKNSQHYMPGQSCCVQCASELHPMLAKRWENFARGLGQSFSERELIRLTRGQDVTQRKQRQPPVRG
jgi:hypothetical protein